MLFKFGFALVALSANVFGSTVSQDCFPHGIRDPSLPVAFIQSENSVKSIRLSDGGPIWTYSTTGRPIALWDDRIAIQVGLGQREFRIAILDKTTGALVIRSEGGPIRPGSEPTYSSPCPISAALSDNALLLEWKVRSRYVGGANPPRDFLGAATETIMQGKMNLSTGRMLITSRDVHEDGERKRPISQAASYIQKGKSSNAPWSVDGVSVTLIQSADLGTLYLEIAKGKEAQLKKEIRRSHDSADRMPYVSDDGKYIILEIGKSVWAVYSSRDGHEIGKFATSALAEPCVVGDRIYYRSDEPLPESTLTEAITLVAQDLTNGKVAWRETVERVTRGNHPKLPQ